MAAATTHDVIVWSCLKKSAGETRPIRSVGERPGQEEVSFTVEFGDGTRRRVLLLPALREQA